MAEPARYPAREDDPQNAPVEAAESPSIENMDNSVRAASEVPQITIEGAELNLKEDEKAERKNELGTEDHSEMESISEHILSNVEYSISSHERTVPNSSRSAELPKPHASDVSSSFKDSPVPSASDEYPNNSRIIEAISHNVQNPRISESVNTSERTTHEGEVENTTSSPFLISKSTELSEENSQKMEDRSQKESHSWAIPIDFDDTHISTESPVLLPLESSSHSNRQVSESVKEDSFLSEKVSEKVLSEKSDNKSVGEDSEKVASEKSDQNSVGKDLQKDVCKKSELKSSESSQKGDSEKSDHESTAKNSTGSEDFADSLSGTPKHSKKGNDSPAKSSSSEEIIKLDIRGLAAPKIPFTAEKIIFGPPPEDAVPFEDSLDDVPAIKHLLSQFILGSTEESIDIKEIMEKSTLPDVAIAESFYDSLNQKLEQSDLLVEELMVHDAKEKEEIVHDDISFQTQTKSLLPDVEMASFSTMTTDYKTICEEYQGKLLHLEELVTGRDEIIDRLTVSLQRSIQEKTHLELQNHHLTNEVQNLQHYVGELSSSDHNTVKGQLSDFIKYENLIKDDSTKFYSAIMTNQETSGSASRSSNSEKDMDREELTINYSKSDPKTSEESDESHHEFDEKLSGIIQTLDEFVVENIRNQFKERVAQLFADEVNRLRLECETEVKEAERQFVTDKKTLSLEVRRLNELLTSVKAGNVELEKFRQHINTKHEKEMENLRTYFEKKCSDMEKNYSDDVEQSARAAESGGSASSLEAACEAALPYSSPLRAGGDYRRHSLAQPSDVRLKQTLRKHDQQLEALKAEHVAYMNDLQATHREAICSLEERIHQLKAHIQTAENTEHRVAVYQEDIDLELEKAEDETERAKRDVIMQLEKQIQVLLADPAAELSSWPLELVALRDKISSEAHHTIRQMKLDHQEELSQLRAELAGAGAGSGGEGDGSADKWRRRRNHSFDQNRQLEEVTKERDGLKRVACTLQRVVTHLVAYCAAAEDELNRTVLTELLTHVVSQADASFAEPASKSSSPVVSALTSPADADLNVSAVSRSRRVHFAPDFRAVFADMDEDSLLTYLQQQDDLSLEIKNELDLSLNRLRLEAQELLDLSGRFTGRPSLPSHARRSLCMGESEGTEMRRLVEGMAAQRPHCDTCELQKKHLEEVQTESVEREGMLRAELRAAMLKIALMTDDDQPQADVIAEGYGTVQHPRTPISLPVRPTPVTPPPLDSRSVSLDGSSSGRRTNDLARLTHELDSLAKERDDLVMQLEAANRQLRATRQFVEEQTSEREAERDDFARQLGEMRDENLRLSQRLHSNARILNEVEQLEAQTREMNNAIHALEAKKSESDSELKATLEKISLLRDIIANLESQLEQKNSNESEILEKLEQMRNTIDDRDNKMRNLLGELESLKSEKAELDATCLRCLHATEDEDAYAKLLEKVKEQGRWLEDSIHRRTQQLERLHEAVSSTSCSEPSEDVSIRDQKKLSNEEKERSEVVERLPELLGVWECLEVLGRAEEAAVKRVRDLEMQRTQLKDVAQEVRAERDVLQQRMSEQALKISSLAARLEVQRTHAEALCHESTSQLSVQLHDALAEVQRLTEELESKDRQLSRLRQTADEDKKSTEQQHDGLYNNSCQPKDKIIILERELASAQSKVSRLEALTKTIETDKAALVKQQRECQRQLAERDAQLQELLAIKSDEENEKEQKNEVAEGGKNSARTLSDIVSISDYDEQDLHMRRAEVKHQNISMAGAPYPHENKSLNRTLPPDLTDKPQLSSLNIDHTVDHLDLAHFSPNSLPTYLTSTTIKDKNLFDLYKRNINETTTFGNIDRAGGGDSIKHSTAQGLPDNCSMFPNREVSDSKNVSIEPKKIDFSVEHSAHDNNKNNDNQVKTLKELGITIDESQKHFPDILTQLKHEVTTSRTELERCRTNLKHAEEQLCEFPALKEEVEELKTMLESTVGTMEQDKKFYENQLENFSTTKKLLEQQLAEMSEQVNEKSNDLHLLKEDILRRENMVLELAKEKRNLVNKMTELEMKYETLERKNEILVNQEKENHELKEKLIEFRKMEQLVSEKNLQIDNLNEHLDRLDDLQRCLDDKTEEADRLKETLHEKINVLEQLQDTVQAMSADMNNASSENSKIILENRELREKLAKVEKENESSSFQLQTSISELEKMAACNIELSAKLEDIKSLNNKLKDKECEIEILHEDINYFHDEIASLKQELKMVSRSPSPRDSKSGEEKGKVTERKVNADKKELVRIRKHVSLLQHELAFNKKDLNEKAFELARAKLDVTELKNNLNQASKLSSDREIAISGLSQENSTLRQELQQVVLEKQHLIQQLAAVNGRLREEGDLDELAQKLKAKTEQCRALEEEMEALKQTIERMRDSPNRALAILPANEEQALVRSSQRSPTAELESAVRAQLSYSNRLDDSIMEQILSGASRSDSEDEEVPRLQLDMSKSSSSALSSSSRKLSRLKSDNEKLKMQAANLEARLTDKEALINELNRIRDKLVQDWQTAKLQYETEKDNSGRLQLLLDTQKDTADSLQHQDLNMIQILKKRLESSMEAELQLQQGLQRERLRSGQLERQLSELSGRADSGRDASALRLQRDNQMEANDRLKGEVTLLKSKLEREKTRLVDLQNMLDQNKLQFQRDIEARNEQCIGLKQELAELKRLKHETGIELMRARDTVHAQKNTILELEKKTEFDEHRAELSREMAALKRTLDAVNTREYRQPSPSSETLLQLKEEKTTLQDRIRSLEREITGLKSRTNGTTDDKDQAVRFLHSRCLRLESCRKALVWQKRYLQRVLAGYADLERYLQQHSAAPAEPPARRSFKSVAVAVVCVVRMAFLVRRRQHIRTVSADCLLRRSREDLARDATLPRPAYTSSPPSRDRSAPRAAAYTPLSNQSVFYTPPPAQRLPPVARDEAGQTRGLRRSDVRIYVEPSPIGERVMSAEERSLRACSSPLLRSTSRASSLCEDAASVHSSMKDQRDSAALLAHKLDSMSRRLQQVMESPRDVP